MDKAGKKRLMVLTGTLATAGVVAGTGLLAGSAAAAPPHGEGFLPHSHHVHTGSAGCVEIDSVLFHADHRGLHRGASSSGPDRGPWHGTCDGRLFPGGPTLVSLGFPDHHQE